MWISGFAAGGPEGPPLQEESIRGVVVLGGVGIPELVQEGPESGQVLLFDFEAGEHPAEVGAVVAVVEQADVPAAAKLLQKLHQRTGPFRKLEPAESLVSHVWRAAAD